MNWSSHSSIFLQFSSIPRIDISSIIRYSYPHSADYILVDYTLADYKPHHLLMCILIQQNQTRFAFFVFTSSNVSLWEQKCNGSFLVYVNLFWKLIQDWGSRLGQFPQSFLCRIPRISSYRNMVWKLSILSLSCLEITILTVSVERREKITGNLSFRIFQEWF